MPGVWWNELSNPSWEVCPFLFLTIIFDFSTRDNVKRYAGTLYQCRFTNFTTGTVYFILGTRRDDLRSLSRLRLTLNRAYNFFLKWNINAFFRCFMHEEYVINIVAIYAHRTNLWRFVIALYRLWLLRGSDTRFFRFDV